MKTNLTKQNNPSANICINKSRVKIYDMETDPKIYLTKQTEFQIELFNPTKDVILAKIMLNGTAISQGGLVLNPGERTFLDRYIDVAKKFLFDTYEVENTEAAKEAIKNNGDFRVEFFKERKYPAFIKSNFYPTYGSRTYSSSPSITTLDGVLRGSSTSSRTIGTGIASSNYSSTVDYSGKLNVSDTSASNKFLSSTATFDMGPSATYNTSSFAGMDGMALMASDYFIPCRSDDPKSRGISKLKKQVINETKSIETGRVEEGSRSYQTMKTVNKVFDAWYFHTVEYKMLPTSQKIYTSNDISVKRYCTDCGGKLGKTDKFCSKCGKKN